MAARPGTSRRRRFAAEALLRQVCSGARARRVFAFDYALSEQTANKRKTPALTISQVATGEENGLTLRVYGSKGAVLWAQENPNYLGVYRYGGQPEGPPAEAAAGVPMDAGPVRFAVAGHAQCESACADLADQQIAPDQNLIGALAQIRDLSSQRNGPRFLAYTGGRLPAAGANSPPASAAIGSR